MARGYLAGIVFVTILLIAGVTTGAASFHEGVEFEGGVIPLDEETEAKHLETVSDTLDALDIDTPEHAFVLVHPSGEMDVVVTDEEPVVSVATGVGLDFSSEFDSELGLIVADEISYDSDATRVGIDELSDNTDEYAAEMVEIRGNVNYLSHANDPADSAVVSLQELGVADESLQTDMAFLHDPVDGAAFAAFNGTSEMTTEGEIGMGRVFLIGYGEGFWSSGEAVVQGLVTPLEGSDSSSVLIVPGDVDPVGQEVSSITEVRENPDEYRRQSVSLEGYGAGVTISTQETLLSVAKCAPSSVIIPTVGCAPIPTDTTIHSLVLSDDVSGINNDAISVIGLSNIHQSELVKPQAGEFEITGTLVHSNQIEADLPTEYAIVATDIEQTDASGVESINDLPDRSRQLGDAVIDQLEEYTGEDGTLPGSTGMAGRLEVIDSKYVDRNVSKGDPIVVEVTVANTGGEELEESVEIEDYDGSTLASADVTVNPGEEKAVRLEYEHDSVGYIGIYAYGEYIGRARVNPASDSQGEYVITVADPPEANVEDPIAVRGENYEFEVVVENEGNATFEGTLIVEDTDGGVYANSGVNIELGPGENLTISGEPSTLRTGVRDLKIVDMNNNTLTDAGSVYIEHPESDTNGGDQSDDSLTGFTIVPALIAILLLSARVKN